MVGPPFSVASVAELDGNDSEVVWIEVNCVVTVLAFVGVVPVVG